MTTTTNATIEASTENGWEAYGLLDDADITFTDGVDENGRTAAQVAADCAADAGTEVRVVTEDGKVLGTTVRVLRSDDPANPAWADDLDGTPATADQIAASDAAPQGLIRIDPAGEIVERGGVRVWVS